MVLLGIARWTHGESRWEPLWTWWEHQNPKKSETPPPHPLPKAFNWALLGHIKSSHWLRGISIPKIGCHLFGLQRMLLPFKKESGVSIYSLTFTQCLNVLLCCVLGIYLVLENTWLDLVASISSWLLVRNKLLLPGGWDLWYCLHS